jgi:hypothetical protein
MKPLFTIPVIPELAARKESFFRIFLYGFSLLPTIFIPLNAQQLFPPAAGKAPGAIESSTILPGIPETGYQPFPFANLLDFWPL